MTKADLVNAVAEVTGTKKQAQAAVEAVFDAIAGAMEKGEEVRLIGFGTFKVSERAAREGKNPQTGAMIKIPAKKVARFIPGKALKDSIN
ncbi:MAG: DNA-binding protein HU [Deltaproteobacteria bacterium ADurb.Bin510]|nr:MAG: DNA-binding protein HU [Deltaproteobacteria bacterium ADurb.Bin510]